MTRGALPDDRLQAQSRALADGTRFAVFAHLRDARTPVTVAELTEQFGLNHNAIRQHLAKLLEAGLVVGERGTSSGSGRPPIRYRAEPGVVERLGGSGPFEALAALLVELLDGGEEPLVVGRRAGHRLAAEHHGVGDAVTVLTAVARHLGFEPRLERVDSGTDVVLDRCPFLGPATTSPGIVCTLHQGIAEGIAEATGGKVTIAGLEVRPPAQAGCKIHVVPAV